MSVLPKKIKRRTVIYLNFSIGTSTVQYIVLYAYARVREKTVFLCPNL